MPYKNVKDFNSVTGFNLNTDSILGIQNNELKRLNGNNANLIIPNITAQTGTFSAVDLNSIDVLAISGITLSLTNTNTYISGGVTSVNGYPLNNISGSLNILSGNIVNTGAGLNNKIDSVSGANCFVLQASTINTANADSNKYNYFMGHGRTYSAANGQRLRSVLQNCVAKKVAYTTQQAAASTMGTSGTLYLWNSTKNNLYLLTSGTTGIWTVADANYYEFTGTNLNIPISAGDRISFALNISGAAATVSNLTSMVDLYCYSY